MDGIGDEPWDVVLNGTGLQQSMLALALSRSKKRILHIDSNGYYGQNEAAFSLQEVDEWAAELQRPGGREPHLATSGLFRNLSTWRHPEAEQKGLSFPRAYSLALAPQIIHTRSKMLTQLVNSRAYRQIDFLAVGSFFVYEHGAGDSGARLTRIPSSREDVFSSQSIPAKSKRSLMKLLKFVVDFDAEEQKAVWEPAGATALSEFLSSHFKLDDSLRKYVLALTMTLDGNIDVKDGLTIINRHLTSTGLFGPGFCAVYPKWGGLSEIAQVACRAGAVGGGIYMLGTRVESETQDEEGRFSLQLSNGVQAATSTIVVPRTEANSGAQTISRLVAVVNSPLRPLFEIMVEGAPSPAVAVVAIPEDAIILDQTSTESLRIYALVHSSETGECPSGQAVIYLTSLANSTAKARLEQALDAILDAVDLEEAQKRPTALYKLHYEQTAADPPSRIERNRSSVVFSLPSAPHDLAFNDSLLDPVHEAWRLVVGDEVPEEEYMAFEDREGAEADEETYD